MNADTTTAEQQLLALYDRVADAPDAIPSLRRFVLNLAVQGKLVAQDPTDEPASELLKQIASEKARLVKAGEIKCKPNLPTVEIADEPHALPNNWRWTRFGNIVDFSAGRTPPRNDNSFWNSGDYAWVSIADMENGRAVHTTKETVSEKARSTTFKSPPERPGTIIMSFKLTIGKIARLGIPAFHNEAIISIRPHITDLDPYLFKVLPDLARGGDTKGAIKGATLNRESISNILIPLPPLGEQHRIVAKVEELMALLDRLEATRTVAEITRDRLAAASLDRLTEPNTTPETFPVHARFTLNALPSITSRVDQIQSFRQTILNLAVRGKLVEQDLTDEPVDDQLQAIRSQREAMVQSKELRRERPLRPVAADEPPFAIPDNWKWVRVGDLALFTQYGTSKKAAKSNSGVPVLTMGNIQEGWIIRTNEKRLPETSPELPSLYLKKFDLLYNRTNSAELVGKTGLYLDEDDCLTFASYLIRIRLKTDHTSPIYVNLAMNAPSFRGTQIIPHIKKQTGQANVNGSALKNMLAPLPPLAEQHRIVAKVDELMALCDRLESALVAADSAKQRLLEAVLHNALAVSTHDSEAA